MVRRHGRRYRFREEPEPEPLWIQGMKEVRKIIEATARVAEANRNIPTNFEIDGQGRRKPGEMSIDEAAKILGIDPSSDLPTAKEAFRKLAKEYHPDHNKSQDAYKNFIKIRTAYDVFCKECPE
jgi:DnaJ-domain-containing protein 1